MPAAIRTVILTMPQLLSDLVATLAEDRVALNVIVRLESRLEIDARLTALAPDLILVGLHSGEVDDVAVMVRALAPAATVIALSSDGRTAFVHDHRRLRAVLSDVSPSSLVDVILASRTSD